MDEDATDTPVSRRQFMTAVGGAAAAGAAGTAAAQEEDGEDGGGGATEEVIVGPGGELVYEPDDLEIAVGTTVNFVWDSDNHNIVVDSQPEDANWEGTPGADSKTYDTGYEYSHTFDVTGEYEYFCQPHVGAGMVATIEVVESLDTGGGSSGPVLPQSAKTLAVATTAAMVSVLSLAYFFMRYGGDFETPD